jgi:hypothetical protein
LLGHEIHLRLAVQYISHLPWFPLWGQAPKAFGGRSELYAKEPASHFDFWQVV